MANHRTYDSFGNLESETDTSVDVAFGYTGKWVDPETGYTHHLNRWYDPNIGKWLSEDPIGFEGGDTNISRYVANEVISRTDSNGLEMGYGTLGSLGTSDGEEEALALQDGERPGGIFQIIIDTTNAPPNFDIKAVEENIKTILKNGGIDDPVIVIEDNTPINHLQLGVKYDRQPMYEHAGFFVLHPWVASAVPTTTAVYLWNRQVVEYKHHIRFVDGNPHFLGSTAGDGTEISLEGIKTSEATRQRNPDWDIAYANIIAHEVFYQGFLNYGDKLFGATPGTIESGKADSKVLVTIPEWMSKEIDRHMK